MASLDSQIDRLYQEPLDRFTAERNALAKSLSGADAERVRKLPKPTLVPWAVNQLHSNARGVFDRLRKSGERLRAAQIAALKGRSADLRGAADAHRTALADAVQQATALAEKAGSHPNADELTRTLEALSLAPELPEPPGRLTRALQPAGFEALTGVTPQVRAVREAPAPRGVRVQADREAKARATKEAEERRAREEAERRAQAELGQAEAMLDRAKAAESQARAAWERAKRQVEDVETKLSKLRKARS